MDDVTVTEADRQTAETAWGKYAQCVDYPHREAAIDSIALALAKERQAAHDDVVNGAWKGRVEAKVRELEAECEESAQALGTANARIATLKQQLAEQDAWKTDLASAQEARISDGLKIGELSASIAELETLRAHEENINRDLHKAVQERDERIAALEDVKGAAAILARNLKNANAELDRWKDTAQKAANEALRRSPPTDETDVVPTL